MITLTFIDSDGAEHVIEAEAGISLMENAVNHMVPGILAECGGACICATCHVMLSSEAFADLPPPSSMEVGTLKGAIDTVETSRLACEVIVNEQMHGLRIRLPKRQV